MLETKKLRSLGAYYPSGADEFKPVPLLLAPIGICPLVVKWQNCIVCAAPLNFTGQYPSQLYGATDLDIWIYTDIDQTLSCQLHIAKSV